MKDKNIGPILINKTILNLSKVIENRAVTAFGKSFQTLKHGFVKPDLERIPIQDCLIKNENNLSKSPEDIDISRLEALINKNDHDEWKYFIAKVKQNMKEQTGIEFAHGAQLKKECQIAMVEAAKILKGPLVSAKKLGLTLPDKISVYDLGYNGNKNEAVARMIPQCNFDWSGVSSVEIRLDKNIFSEKYKRDYETIEENVISALSHELDHTRYIKDNYETYNKFSEEGMDAFLNEEDNNTMAMFKNLYEKHYDELGNSSWKKPINVFNTNMSHNRKNPDHENGDYNMKHVAANLQKFIDLITASRNGSKITSDFSDSLMEDFCPELITELSKIQQQFKNIIDTINNENLRAYAFCNPIELSAVAAEKEIKQPLSPEFLKLKKQMRAPETGLPNI